MGRQPVPGVVPVAGNLRPVTPERVLLVLNARSPGSREVAAYYARKRRLPDANVLRIDCPESDEWKAGEYRERLERFVRDRARRDPKLDAVVLTRGVPFRFSDFGTDGGYSVDSVLATCLLPSAPKGKCANLYFGAHTRFSCERFGMLLVTRLDGPSVEVAKRMVDSSLAAKPAAGPFFLRDSFCLGMKPANEALTRRGFSTLWVEGHNNPRHPDYGEGNGPFMAHYGAGPHDTQFSPQEYAAMRFLPGAVADLTWSVSAAALRRADSAGNVATLAANGAAGAQGYVSEPYADAVSRPEVVLDRYTRGHTLAESFYAGTPYLHWKQVVLGDPLCAPYADTAGKEPAAP